MLHETRPEPGKRLTTGQGQAVMAPVPQWTGFDLVAYVGGRLASFMCGGLFAAREEERHWRSLERAQRYLVKLDDMITGNLHYLRELKRKTNNLSAPGSREGAATVVGRTRVLQGLYRGVQMTETHMRALIENRDIRDLAREAADIVRDANGTMQRSPTVVDPTPLVAAFDEAADLTQEFEDMNRELTIALQALHGPMANVDDDDLDTFLAALDGPAEVVPPVTMNHEQATRTVYLPEVPISATSAEKKQRRDQRVHARTTMFS